MRRVLSICRDYGQPLSWWLGLDTGEQSLYLADSIARRPPDGG